ncbi:sortase [Candidatus Dojkabacteria bacterium]|uniref:Sortase n=1 Tax=Candidatus Dojkabacteria bacterium TaxID=2099670 RepID=A0A955LAG0_9BACT|nr:sortase [Candidatus Dojkabacteria bacterium]
MKKFLNIIAHINITLGLVLIIVPLGYLGLSATHILEPNTVFATDAKKETEIITSKPLFLDETKSVNSQVEFDIPSDSAADLGNKLIVPTAGINTTIWESEIGTYALDKGVWRMPYHEAPDSDISPVVLAAHRWGANSLTWEYRKQNLFLNLPDVKVGDEITIVWFGEEIKYRANHTEVNTEVSRIDDLILVTCQSYHTLNRVFVYAERID